MKLKLRHHFPLLLCFTVLTLAGCVFRNSRQTEFGPVSARAHLTKGVASYYEINIRRPNEPSAPRIWIRLPDGKVIDRKSFNYTALSKLGFLDSSAHDFQPDKEYMNALSRYGASFFFNNGELISMHLFVADGNLVGIARAGTNQFRSLPLTQQELEQIFGRPDDTSEGFHL
jgi:hypothetical protein